MPFALGHKMNSNSPQSPQSQDLNANKRTVMGQQKLSLPFYRCSAAIRNCFQNASHLHWPKKKKKKER